jgi:hypothetical protein
MSGNIYRIKDYRIVGSRLIVPLTFGPEESKFIVISRHISTEDPPMPEQPRFADSMQKNPSTGNSGETESMKFIDLTNARWTVSFTQGWGPEKPVELTELKSWTTFTDPEIRYYSGSAVYRTTFDLPETFSNGKIWLDLGNVQELCSIRINGQDAGTLWFPPFNADITGYLKTGENSLEATVYNLWPNRLIGDSGLPTEKRRTRTNITKFDGPDSEKYLRVSGLLGPVRVIMAGKK